MTRMPVPIERDRVEHRDDPVRDRIIVPAPAVSLRPGRPLRAPDPQFIADIAMAIRVGVRPMTAAQWLGVSRKTWKLWKVRRGSPYDTLRAAVRSALANVEATLRSQLSPGQALKGLKPIRDDEPEEPTRAYHRSGVHTLTKALPHLLDRVNDSTIPESDLSPVESAARTFRNDLIADLGGAAGVATARIALITACTGSWLILNSVDAYLFEMAAQGGLVSRKHRKLFAVVEQRARLADSLTKQLLALGLEKHSPPPLDLNTYIAAKYGSTENGDPTPADTAKEP